MNKTRKLMMLGLLPVMFACGGAEESDETNEDEDQVTEEACTYSYDESSTVLTWTAFKTSEKVAVNGTFDKINVTAKESDDMLGVFDGATFEIPINTLNTQDPVRDHKLKNSFFGNMETTEMITGTIVSMTETEAVVDITMNGGTVSYDGTVEIDGETVTLSIVMDILDFDGQLAMDSLSVVCAEKHTGEDGENRLWSDVGITAKTTLKKDCAL